MRIPVRDGITLSARVWLPAESEKTPLPAILEILPYRKRDGTAVRDATTHAQFAKHDYVCLRVDLRGCGESEGLFDDEYSEQELRDVEDTIAWIAKQPWCSGAVGIMGISWGGFNGLQVASRQPAALKAVISLCSSVDRFADDIHYKGGCQLTENIGWAATAMSWFSMPPDPALAGDNWRDIWLERLENTPFLIGEWLSHPTRDDYWKHGSACEDFSRIKAPVLIIGGWHDGYRNTPAKLLEGGTSGVVKAIVGPWNHKYPHLASPKPRMDFVHEALRWWDHWLKGIPNNVSDDPAYRVYIMDGIAPCTTYDMRPGRWIGLPAWPAPETESTRFCFGDGRLGGAEMSQPVRVETHAICGRGFGEYFPFGFGPGELPDDQRADDALSACFDTAPLNEAMTILGAPRVQVSLSSDKPFGQIAVRLCDVAADGASTLITYGLLNLQFRDGFDTAVPMIPGQTFDVTVDLDQAAYVVSHGHTLRVSVSASYWPFIWPERDRVALTICQGSIVLPTLQHPDPGGLEWVCPDHQSEIEPLMHVIKTGTEEKNLLSKDGQDILVISGDHGETELPDTGLRLASKRHEVWSIDHHDVSRASAQINWDRSMSREDFEARTRVEAKMRSDSDHFHVSFTIRANDGGRCFFERKFNESFRRGP